MKDGVGQYIEVGDKVFHSGTRDIEPGVYDVVGMTAKMISVLGDWTKRHPSKRGKPVLWHPNRVVVVNDNLEVAAKLAYWENQ